MVTNVDRSLIEYLMGEKSFSTDGKAVEFSYISNPDGTIRWIYPKTLKKPYFLNFYSTASLRAKILSSVIRLAFFMGQSHRIESGDLRLNISENSRLGKVLNEYPHVGFSIFTGTIGENRKAVIELHDNKRLFAFVKIALTEAAKTLVHNEAKCLQDLNIFKFNVLVVPKLLSNNELDTMGLSNIKPKNFQQHASLTNLHIEALSELYEQTSSQKKWIDLHALLESKNRVKSLLDDSDIVNGLDKNRIQDMANKILVLINMLEDKEDRSIVAVSHGDFTPWNMYSSKNVLHLFDWELSQNDIPVLFDLFHFVFQSEVMVKHAGYMEIRKELQKMVQMKSTQVLINDLQLDVNKHYAFYLVYNVTYYLNKYIKQKQLHEQVFWLIDVWEDAINDVIDKKGVLFEK